MPESTLEIQNYDDDLLILKSTDHSSMIRIGEAIFHKQFDFVEEVIVTEAEVLLKLNHRFDAGKIALIQGLAIGKEKTGKLYRLPVYFGSHEDWEQVLQTTGMQQQAFINTLISAPYSIAMLGFLPGFLYLNGLDPALHVPRKSTPSKYISANSVAIGGKYLGLYSLDSPGGWHVIGQTPISLLKIPDTPPLALNLCDSLQLHPIDETEYTDLCAQNISIHDYNA